MNNLHLVSQEENDAQERMPYEAFTSAPRRQRRIMLYDAEKRLIGMPSYTYYVDAVCTSPRYLWLLFSTTAFRLKGRNLLGEMLILLQDDRIRSLQCYSPARFEPPADDAVVIESITRHSLKEFTAAQANDNEI